MKHYSVETHDAERGALYNSANSPKPSPDFTSFFSFPFIKMFILPFSSKKNEDALSPYFIIVVLG